MPAHPRVFAVVDGKLYMFSDSEARKNWKKDVSGNIARASERWPEVTEDLAQNRWGKLSTRGRSRCPSAIPAHRQRCVRNGDLILPARAQVGPIIPAVMKPRTRQFWSAFTPKLVTVWREGQLA